MFSWIGKNRRTTWWLTGMRGAGRLVQAGAALTLVSGCTLVEPTRTGFLSNPTELVGSGDPQFVSPRLNTTRYTAFFVEPVVYRPAAGTGSARPSEATLRRLTAAYDRSLINAFSERYRRSDRPGPGVLRIRAAVTDVKAGDPLINVAMMGGKGMALARGGAATEAEAVDSVTGERLVALSGSNNGGLSMMGSGSEQFTTYGDAEAAFKVQAEKLRDLISPSPSLGEQVRQAFTW